LFQINNESPISSFLDQDYPKLLKEIEDMQTASEVPQTQANQTQSSPPSNEGRNNNGSFNCLPVSSVLVKEMQKNAYFGVDLQLFQGLCSKGKLLPAKYVFKSLRIIKIHEVQAIDAPRKQPNLSE